MHSSQARLPFFLGLGVQKGGTTTLQGLMAQHPQLWLPASKEVHYFTLHYNRGVDWYRDQFVGASPNQRCGDITPYYIFHPQAPLRIHHLLPEARLIVLLRDPVERALSQVFHSQRLGLEPLELEQALSAEEARLAGAEAVLARRDGRHMSHQEHSYLARSRYEEQLVRYRGLFREDQLMVCRSEDFFEQPALFWGKLLGFLQLDPHPFPEVMAANVGRGEALSVPLEVRQRVREQLQPTYEAMKQDYGLVW
jgi:hypothetical protein